MVIIMKLWCFLLLMGTGVRVTTFDESWHEKLQAYTVCVFVSILTTGARNWLRYMSYHKTSFTGLVGVTPPGIIKGTIEAVAEDQSISPMHPIFVHCWEWRHLKYLMLLISIPTWLSSGSKSSSFVSNSTARIWFFEFPSIWELKRPSHSP